MSGFICKDSGSGNLMLLMVSDSNSFHFYSAAVLPLSLNRSFLLEDYKWYYSGQRYQVKVEYQALTASMLYFSDKRKMLLMKENPDVMSVLMIGKIVFVILEEML